MSQKRQRRGMRRTFTSCSWRPRGAEQAPGLRRHRRRRRPAEHPREPSPEEVAVEEVDALSPLLGRSRTTHFTRFLQKPPSHEKSCLFSGTATIWGVTFSYLVGSANCYGTSVAGGAAGAVAGAGGGGDGDAAARSSSVRGGVDGVGASEASEASGASASLAAAARSMPGGGAVASASPAGVPRTRRARHFGGP